MSENETRYYSDSEIDLLIDDLTVAALEAIEQAAGEAARAAFLASLEREAAALQMQKLLLQDVKKWKKEAGLAKKSGVKNAVIAGFVCFLGGVIFGVVGTISIKN